MDAEGADDMGTAAEVVVVEEGKTEESEEDEEVEEEEGRCPFPIEDWLRKSVAAEGNMFCRSASVCPGV